MKHLVWILLAALLLTGCGIKTPTDEADAPVAVSEPVSLYMANTSVEQQTGGAVTAYVPEAAEYLGMAAMDGNIVLVTGQSRLVLLDGEKGSVITSVDLGATLESMEDITVSDQGISYYCRGAGELVMLNTRLQEVQTLVLPEKFPDNFCVSHETQEVYYCNGTQIRAVQLQTGISRMVKTLTGQNAELTGCQLEGTILSCRITDGQGVIRDLYIDSTTGQTIEEAKRLLYLKSDGDQFMVGRYDGIHYQQLFGKADGQIQNFTLSHQVTPAFGMGGAYRWYMEDSALVLDYYDFEAGVHSAQTRMLGVSEPMSIDAAGQYIWLLATEGNVPMLFRWDPEAIRLETQTPCVEPLYTLEQPDEKGLAECEALAKELEAKYGVQVRIGPEAAQVTGGNTVTAEHQVPVLRRLLEQLDEALATFPKNFLAESVARGEMIICLVREINSGSNMVQFYVDGDAYILLSAREHIVQSLYHGVAYVIDSHVLGNSRDYDTWMKLNPSGFDYDYSYHIHETHSDSEYLTGDNRAFVDTYAMTYPHEDRCRLFVYAMTEGNESVFENLTMQAKLKRMCQGIREAYGYERNGNTYPWEQYLNTSLAHKTY